MTSGGHAGHVQRPASPPSQCRAEKQGVRRTRTSIERVRFDPCCCTTCLAAAALDTGISTTEKHYGAIIVDATAALLRQNMVSRTPADVVPLRVARGRNWTVWPVRQPDAPALEPEQGHGSGLGGGATAC